MCCRFHFLINFDETSFDNTHTHVSIFGLSFRVYFHWLNFQRVFSRKSNNVYPVASVLKFIAPSHQIHVSLARYELWNLSTADSTFVQLTRELVLVWLLLFHAWLLLVSPSENANHSPVALIASMILHLPLCIENELQNKQKHEQFRYVR